MTKTTFKAGDKVVFLNRPGNEKYGSIHHLTVGKTYEVLSITPEGDCVRIKDDRGTKTSGFFYRFALAKDAKFKKGDRIVLTDTTSMDYALTKGKTYEVLKDQNFSDCVAISDDDGSWAAPYAWRFTLEVKPNFNKGDYVTCLNNALYEDKLTARGIYKVIDAYSTHGFDYIRVEGRGEVTVTAHSSRFKLWAAAEEFSKHPPEFPKKTLWNPKSDPKNSSLAALALQTTTTKAAPPTTPPIMGLYIPTSVINGLVEDYVKKHYGIHQKVDKVHGGTEYIDVVFVK